VEADRRLRQPEVRGDVAHADGLGGRGQKVDDPHAMRIGEGFEQGSGRVRLVVIELGGRERAAAQDRYLGVRKSHGDSHVISYIDICRCKCTLEHR
jgi:hypothetical protein